MIKNKNNSVDRIVTMPSPKVVKMTARGNNALVRERTGLHHNNDNLIQSQEGALNVPRPRFKMNDGQNEQVESIMSHFSQSEINNREDSVDADGSPRNAHGTMTIGLNNRMNNRLQEQVSKGQHSS